MSGLDVAIVINNAGVLYNGLFKDIQADKQRELALINSYPYILLTRALLPQLKSRGQVTTIVNMASSAGNQPQPYAAIYSCTKAFDLFFSEALSHEQLSSGGNLEVLTVSPMIVQTSMTNNVAVSWSTGATSCEQYIEYLVRCLS